MLVYVNCWHRHQATPAGLAVTGYFSWCLDNFSNLPVQVLGIINRQEKRYGERVTEWREQVLFKKGVCFHCRGIESQPNQSSISTITFVPTNWQQSVHTALWNTWYAHYITPLYHSGIKSESLLKKHSRFTFTPTHPSACHLGLSRNGFGRAHVDLMHRGDPL